VRGRIRGRKFIWARDSTWKTPRSRPCRACRRWPGPRAGGRQRPLLPVVEARSGRRPCGCRTEHPSARTSTLRMPRLSMSSLSQQMTVRSSIVAFSMGTSSSSRPSVMMKPPTCWERWRGKPWISWISSSVWARRRSVGVEADLAQALMFEPFGREEAPELGGDGRDRVVGQAHGAAHLADGALAAVVDDGGAEARAVAAVALVDVLDHLFAPFVFEIDVDVGGFVAGLGHEAFEDHRADLRARPR
jgi:hypothetical protein